MKFPTITIVLLVGLVVAASGASIQSRQARQATFEEQSESVTIGGQPTTGRNCVKVAVFGHLQCAGDPIVLPHGNNPTPAMSSTTTRRPPIGRCDD